MLSIIALLQDAAAASAGKGYRSHRRRPRRRPRGARRRPRHRPDRRLGHRGHGPPAGEHRPDPDRHDHLRRADRGRRAVRGRHRVPDPEQHHVLGLEVSHEAVALAHLRARAGGGPRRRRAGGARRRSADGRVRPDVLDPGGLRAPAGDSPEVRLARHPRRGRGAGEGARGRSWPRPSGTGPRRPRCWRSTRSSWPTPRRRPTASWSRPATLAEKERAVAIEKTKQEQEELLARARREIAGGARPRHRGAAARGGGSLARGRVQAHRRAARQRDRPQDGAGLPGARWSPSIEVGHHRPQLRRGAVRPGRAERADASATRT